MVDQLFLQQKKEGLKKILFIVHHRKDRSPGQRYRFEQYFDYLEKNGVECHLANIISEEDDQVLYSHGNYLKKGMIALNAYKKRWSDLKNVKDFDLIVLYREAILTRSTVFERKFAKSGVPMVFDFDDAIWVKDVSAGNQSVSFLKNANKIQKILPLCAHITAGNQYLKEFALKYNPNVTVFPSTIDTDKYMELERQETGQVIIGWVGSHTTVKHFEQSIPVLKRLKQKYGDKVSFTLIGDPNYKNDELGIVGVPWSNEREVELFNKLDVGIMPLPDNEWTRGKCGMKGLLYMSVGKPAVMSAVGMNTEIVEEGVNGFLPIGEEEWFKVLSSLVEDDELRKKVGANGRTTVEERYSLKSQQERLLKLYLSLMK